MKSAKTLNHCHRRATLLSRKARPMHLFWHFRFLCSPRYRVSFALHRWLGFIERSFNLSFLLLMIRSILVSVLVDGRMEATGLKNMSRWHILVLCRGRRYGAAPLHLPSLFLLLSQQILSINLVLPATARLYRCTIAEPRALDVFCTFPIVFCDWSGSLLCCTTSWSRLPVAFFFSVRSLVLPPHRQDFFPPGSQFFRTTLNFGFFLWAIG